MAPEQKLQVENVRQVYSDGRHNAFTDLCRFGDWYYLTFRSCPDGHGIFPTSRIRILRSRDAVDWEQVHDFSVPRRDVRDPHFLEFQGRLFVYSGAWLCDPSGRTSPDINDHLGYCAWSDDGTTWSGPRFMEGTYGHYIWRAAAHGGKAFLCGRRRSEFMIPEDPAEYRPRLESALLSSDDGFVWRTAGLFAEEHGNETAFVVEDDGEIVALCRSSKAGVARVCRSRPPYVEWTRTQLDRLVGGPLLAKWGGRYLVGGRKTMDRDGPRTTLYWLADEQLVEIVELPSGGDNSYPGFVAFDDARGLVSWYSSHEGSGGKLAPSAIYLADLKLS